MWVVLAGLAAIALSAAPEKSAAVHFVPYRGEYAYGLEIAPPWPGGGSVVINFPEHLERFPDTQGILRHNDPIPAGRWVVSPDGRRAELVAESANLPGVHVHGRAWVAARDRVEFAVRITNRSDRDLAGIIPLYCLHYRGLAGFPQWQGNFAHTFAVLDGAVTALADVPTEKPGADVKAAYVRGVTQRDTEEFPRSRGGLIARAIDRALVAVTSLDGRRALLYAWTPGKTLLSNAAIPCAHADPYYGPIPRGASSEPRGVLVFTEQPLARAVESLVHEGAGDPSPR